MVNTHKTPLFLAMLSTVLAMAICSCGGGGGGGGSALGGSSTSASSFQSTVTANPAAGIPANGTTASTITVTIRDGFGAPMSGLTVKISTAADGDVIARTTKTSALGKGNTIILPTSGPTGDDGVATARLTSTTAGIITLEVTVNPLADPLVLDDRPTVEFNLLPPSPSRSTATANPVSGIPANGTTASTITVTVRNSLGTPMPGQDVEVSATGSGNTITLSGPTNDDGVTTATIVSTVAETKTLTITTNPKTDPIVLDDQPVVEFIEETNFIPEGEFEMGDHLLGMAPALPVHTVHIGAFFMDVFETTNDAYCAYLNSAYAQGLIAVTLGEVHKKGDTERYCGTHSATSNSRIHWDGAVFSVTAGKKNHPMNLVSWFGAAAFANWRSDQEGLPPCYDLDTWECAFGAGGYRLPTEAEWEKAARGGKHASYYRYPWGNTVDGSMANFLISGDPFEGTTPETTPVGYYNGNQIPSGPDMANGYGLYNMAGNLWEWCNDWYDSGYYSYSPIADPTGPASNTGSGRVLRGGSWDGGAEFMRCALRGHLGPPKSWRWCVGFRLVLE
jgi:formylglycine-generating enzyme required for sulfatase activity